MVVKRSMVPVISDNLLRRNRGFIGFSKHREAKSLEIQTFHLSDGEVRI